MLVRSGEGDDGGMHFPYNITFHYFFIAAVAGCQKCWQGRRKNSRSYFESLRVMHKIDTLL